MRATATDALVMLLSLLPLLLRPLLLVLLNRCLAPPSVETTKDLGL